MAILEVRIIVRPSFPERKDILLVGDVDTSKIPVDTLAKLAYTIETTLNEQLPQIRVHTSVKV